VLSQGILGSKGNIPKVACPLHKNTFNLQTGECLDTEEMSLLTFPVRIEDEKVMLFLPPTDELDKLLGTKSVMFGAECPSQRDFAELTPF